MTRDHVVPKADNGPDDRWNIVPTCRRCNEAKGDKYVYEWLPRERADEFARYFKSHVAYVEKLHMRNMLKQAENRRNKLRLLAS